MVEHLEVENTILLKPEYDTLQNLHESLKLEEHDISRIHIVMMNWYMHYGEICEQFRKSRESLSDILQARNVMRDLELLQKIEQQIVMEKKRIEDLQE